MRNPILLVAFLSNCSAWRSLFISRIFKASLDYFNIYLSKVDNHNMGNVDKRFNLTEEPGLRKFFTFQLDAGDGALRNGLFQVFPNGFFKFHAEISSTDTNDTWLLKFTFVDAGGHTIEVRPEGNGDPHTGFHMDNSHQVYIWEEESSLMGSMFQERNVLPATYQQSVYIDVSYDC